jgi:hypothetical protein
MKRTADRQETKLALANSTTSGALTGTAVDATGFSRAKFVFTFGLPLANGSIGSLGIWAAAGSNSSVAGATTYVSIAAAQLVGMSSLAVSNQVAVIDMAIPQGSVWLLVSGTVSTSSIPLSGTVALYEPNKAPPSHAAVQTVFVN